MAKTQSFKARVANVMKSAKSVRGKVQAFVVEALEHYAEHGDTEYLTQLMEATIGVNFLRTNTLKAFIKDHANVTWVKTADKKRMVFKKIGKQEVAVKEVTTNWYEFNNEGNAKPDMNLESRIRSLITATKNAITDGKLRKEDEELARTFLANSEPLVAK